jgi:hypothetical protein
MKIICSPRQMLHSKGERTLMSKSLKCKARALNTLLVNLLLVVALPSIRAQERDKTDRSSLVEKNTASTMLRTEIDEPRTLFKGKVTEFDRAVEGVVIVAKKSDCLCSSCTGADKPCNCCIDQRAVTDAKGEYRMGRLTTDKVDLIILRNDQVEGRFAGLDANRDRKERIDFELGASRKKPDAPQRERP